MPPDPPRSERTPEEAFEHAILAAELGDAPSIDLHGLDRHDAVLAVDAFISRESVKGTDAIKIIQGRGEGTLRRVLLRHLFSHPLVALARDAVQRPGEQGGVIYAALHDARLKRKII